jgi:ClpP class serine protease
MKPYWEKQGVVFHEINASASTDKNAAFAEARKGNYEPLVEQVLDPINEVFMATMRKHRGLKDELMTGKTYIASAAIANGMADRIGTLDQLVEHIKNVNSKTTMSTKKGLFGLTWGGDDAPAKAAEEIQQLQAQTEDLSAKLVDANAQLKQAQEALATANAALATATEERNQYKALAEKYGAKPAGTPTVAQKAGAEGEAATEGFKLNKNAAHNVLASQISK